jgi:hypothetical protein
MTTRPLRAHTSVPLLEAIGACTGPESAQEWLLSLPAETTARQAWQQCQRGDWMLWLLGRLSGPPESDARKRLVLCAGGCARLALVHIPAGEDSPRIAIETGEAWTRGEATIKQVRLAAAAAAASAAYAASTAAAYAASTAYAAYAAAASAASAAYAAAAAAAYAAYAASTAAAYAAYAASTAAAAAASAAYAAYAAAASAASAAYAAAAAAAADAADAADDRSRILAQCAAIVRSHYRYPPRLRGSHV